MKHIKALGQHFLNEPLIAAEIVSRSGINSGDLVWEIGPGKGILTAALVDRGCRLRCFELDRRLEQPLRQRFGERIELVMGDVLKYDWAANVPSKQPLNLVANIPYSITSPLLHLLERHHAVFAQITLMVQQEVAERICAHPGTKAYGVMTLRLRRIFASEIWMLVPKTSFTPVPQVDSAVLSLRPRAIPPDIPNLPQYLRLIDLAFANRRKTLRNKLVGIADRDRLEKISAESGIDLARRGETLSEAEFIALSRCL